MVKLRLHFELIIYDEQGGGGGIFVSFVGEYAREISRVRSTCRDSFPFHLPGNLGCTDTDHQHRKRLYGILQHSGIPLHYLQYIMAWQTYICTFWYQKHVITECMINSIEQ